MKNLAVGLLVAIVPLAASPLLITSKYAVAASALGDLSAMRTIVSDTLALAKAGDLVGAEKRIGDYEAAWDAGEPTLRPLDTATWTSLDHDSDTAIEALCSGSPSIKTVVPPLEALAAAPANATVPTASIAATATFSLTNADGSPVPCETVLRELRRISESRAPSAADQARFDELQTKGIERCNADDDKRADTFFGEALALLNK